MASFLTDNEDLLYYLNDGVDWASLAEVTEYGWRAPDGFKNGVDAKQFYVEVATMMGELVAEQIAPRAAKIDREGTHLENGEAVESPSMKEAFDAINAAEMHKLCIPRELGGLNAPLLLYFLCGEMVARADLACMNHFSFHGGMAMAALAYSVNEGTTDVRHAVAAASRRRASPRRSARSRAARPGAAWTSPSPTPAATWPRCARARSRTRRATGSSPGRRSSSPPATASTTSSSPGPRRRRTRTIRSPACTACRCSSSRRTTTCPDGTRKRHVTLERIEEKLGHHGAVTAALSFERAPARLIGKRGEGFKYMLVLMNNARVGVGFESIGLAQAAYNMAKAYAEERRSMGKAIARHEMLADYLDEMQTDIQAMRALGVAGAFHEEMSRKLELIGKFTETGKPEDAARNKRALKKHTALARRFTPLLKYLATEKAVEIARRNMQIHGGVGYTQGVRRREAAPRLAGPARLRGHQPDPVAHGDEGHAVRHRQEAAGVRDAHGPGALAIGVGARSARAARRQAADALDVGAAVSPHAHRGRQAQDADRRPGRQVERRCSRTGIRSATSRSRCSTPSGSRAS